MTGTNTATSRSDIGQACTTHFRADQGGKCIDDKLLEDVTNRTCEGEPDRFSTALNIEVHELRFAFVTHACSMNPRCYLMLKKKGMGRRETRIFTPRPPCFVMRHGRRQREVDARGAWEASHLMRHPRRKYTLLQVPFLQALYASPRPRYTS